LRRHYKRELKNESRGAMMLNQPSGILNRTMGSEALSSAERKIGNRMGIIGNRTKYLEKKWPKRTFFRCF